MYIHIKRVKIIFLIVLRKIFILFPLFYTSLMLRKKDHSVIAQLFDIIKN